MSSSASSSSGGGAGGGGAGGSTSSSGSVAHLTNSALPLVALRDYYRAELAQLLTLPSHTSASSTKKALVLDKSLSGPLGLVSEVSFLQSHGVEQIHHLKDPDLVTPANHIMYFVRPILANMRIIASHILNQRAREPSLRRTYSVFFVPRKSMLCEKELEQLGVLGDIRHLEEFHFELIPFEEDVLSMEMSSAFKDTFLDGDPTSLLYMARSLMKLQSLVGLIPTIKGKGNNAFKLYSLLQRLRREGGFNIGSSGSQSNVSSEIDSLILIDRSVDFVTPLLTQLTYEGLIDEIFGIKNSYIDVDADMIGGNKPANPPAGGAPPPPSGPKKLLLNSVDTLFKETRDLNFRVLGPLLHKKAEYIKDTYSERHSAQTVTEMHSFMQRFKTAHAEHNLLQTHINLAERISNQFKSKLFDRKLEIERWCLDGNETDACEEYVEACICKQEPLVAVLRLMCLVSLTQGGLKQKKFEHWKREFLHTYGFQHLFTLNNLEKLGMFTCNSSLKLINQGGRGWANLRKGLKLTTPSEKVDISNPTDFNYIFNGYAPLSVRLIEIAHKPGWRRFEELLGFVPGKSFEFRQEASAATLAVPAVNLLETKTANTPTAQNPGGLAGLAALAGGATTAQPDDRKDNPASAAGASGTRKKPLTLVCFLGGVSMSEISALRYLSEREDHGRDYIICTTKLINGATFVDSLQEQIINKLNGGVVPPAGRAGGAAAAASRR